MGAAGAARACVLCSPTTAHCARCGPRKLTSACSTSSSITRSSAINSCSNSASASDACQRCIRLRAVGVAERRAAERAGIHTHTHPAPHRHARPGRAGTSRPLLPLPPPPLTLLQLAPQHREAPPKGLQPPLHRHQSLLSHLFNLGGWVGGVRRWAGVGVGGWPGGVWGVEGLSERGRTRTRTGACKAACAEAGAAAPPSHLLRLAPQLLGQAGVGGAAVVGEAEAPPVQAGCLCRGL